MYMCACVRVCVCGALLLGWLIRLSQVQKAWDCVSGDLFHGGGARSSQLLLFPASFVLYCATHNNADKFCTNAIWKLPTGFSCHSLFMVFQHRLSVQFIGFQEMLGSKAAVGISPVSCWRGHLLFFLRSVANCAVLWSHHFVWTCKLTLNMLCPIQQLETNVQNAKRHYHSCKLHNAVMVIVTCRVWSSLLRSALSLGVMLCDTTRLYM